MNCLRFSIKTFAIFVLLFIFLAQNSVAQWNSHQPTSDLAELISISQSYYGANDELINGFIHPLPDPGIQGHPYLLDEWEEGTLFIKGNTFQGIPVKYDLVLDEIIIKVKTENNIERLISINKQQIDSLHFNNSFYVNSKILFQDDTNSAFYELIFTGSLSLEKKYEKRFIGMYSSSAPRGKYSDVKTSTFLFDGEQLTPVDSKNSFLKYFDKNDQKRIKSFFRQNKMNYRKATPAQLVELMDFCTQTML